MSFTSLIDKFPAIKILVIGDIMLDHYIIGDVHRISPEAPVPVVVAQKDTYTLGGAANVALNLSNLDIETLILGYCANDDAGLKIYNAFGENGIKPVLQLTEPGPQTIVKTRVIIRGQQLCRIDREGARELYDLEKTTAFENDFLQAVEQVDAVILSDYAKGVVTQSLVNKLVATKKFLSGALFVAADPKPVRKLNLSGLSLLTPNKSEACELAELNGSEKETTPLEDVCRLIYEKYQPRLLIITLGAEGMAVSVAGKLIRILPTVARQVFDVSGAGDTVVSILTASLAAGADPVEAATLANIAAGAVVSKHGTAAITLKELRSLV